MSTDPYGSPPPDPYASPNPSARPYFEPADAGYSPRPDRSEAASRKLAARICGSLLGSFGVHKFMLGYTNAGAIMLAVSVATFVGTVATCGMTAPLSMAMGVIGLAEGIIYL